MTIKLETTPERLAVREACEGCHDWSCTGCMYRYTCEELFPVTSDAAHRDAMPSEYQLTDDGLYLTAGV